MDKYLSPGYELNLNDQLYTITGLLGAGATCAAYTAERENQQYIVKEYCPSYIDFIRDPSGEICFSEEAKRIKFAEGKSEFRNSYERQKKIRSEAELTNSTPFTDTICECNNTEYFIVVPYRGATYKDKVESMELIERIKVCRSMAELALKYHNAGYLMLDIKPDNMFIITETLDFIKYIDFDSIRTKEEISFGRSLSYTENWAAPEQINPYSFNKISEKTDIYAIGEIVFWSVFGRHSKDIERIRAIGFPFDDKGNKFFTNLENPEVRRLFTELFCISIRSSVNYRASSMQLIVEKLEEIISELEKGYFIIPASINTNKIFLGRENELSSIQDKLLEDHILFLSGIGGIGKSELAKQYAKRSNKHCCYITYEHSLIDSVIKDIDIKNFTWINGEKEEEHCLRKLKKLNELITEEHIIIVDNMNVRLSDMSSADKQAWDNLIKCKCDIIITTRCGSNEYPEQIISEIKDEEDVMRLYNEYYGIPYVEDEKSSVREIVRQLSNHTLLVELIAKQAKEAARSPKEMLSLLCERGVLDFGTDKVTLRKDNKNDDVTVKECLKRLFDTSNLSDEHKLVLAELSLMPTEGIDQATFCAFFELEDHNNIKYLRDNGWINRKDNIISVHPVISEVAVDGLKNDIASIDFIYDHIYDLIDPLGNNKLSYVKIYDSIALKTMGNNITVSNAIEYIKLYILVFRHNGKAKQKIELIDYALNYIETNNVSLDDWVERLYDIKADIIIKNDLDMRDIVLKICYEHINKAKTSKSTYWKMIWEYLYFIILHKYGNSLKAQVYRLKAFKEIMQFDLESLEVDNLVYFVIRIPELYEHYCEMDYVRSSEAIKHLESAIRLRKRLSEVLSVPSNELIIALDEAKCFERQNIISEAIATLERALIKTADYHENYITYILECHLLLAHLYEEDQKLKESEREYERCIALENEIYDNDSAMIFDSQIGLGRLYCEAYNVYGKDYEHNWRFIEKYNLKLYSELRYIDKVYSEYYCGETCYNMGYINQIEGFFDTAMFWYNEAISHYGYISKSRGYKQIVSFIRIKLRMSEIEYVRGNIEDAIALVKEALKLSKGIYGNDNKQTMLCKEKLKEYKNKK